MGSSVEDYCRCCELPQASGIIKKLQSYILKNSYREQPMFALGTALSVMSTVLGRRYVFKNTAPNLYTMLLGPSGSGKQAPQDCAHQILMQSNNSRLIGSGSFVSDASLMDTLEAQPERLDTLDEAGGLLKSMTKGGNDYQAKMADILCNLWSTSNSIFLGRTTASKSKVKCSECREEIEEANKKGECYRPSVNLIMATTFAALEESVTTQTLDKGLLGRFLVFKSVDKPQAKSDIDSSLLETKATSLLDRIRQKPVPVNRKYQHKGASYPVKEVFCGDEVLFNKHFKTFLDMADESSEGIRPVITRLPQQYKKIALCHAAGRGIDGITVDTIDLEFAYNVCMYNVSMFQDIINSYLFKTARDREMKLVIRYLSDTPLVSLDDMSYDLFHELNRKKIQDILQELELQGIINRVHLEDNKPGVQLLTS